MIRQIEDKDYEIGLHQSFDSYNNVQLMALEKSEFDKLPSNKGYAAARTISEAVVFGKPNLILTTPGSVDAGRWREQGVALYISDFASLKEAVETILEDKETRERFHKTRELYIRRHYYCLDGKATERICNLILSQIGAER